MTRRLRHLKAVAERQGFAVEDIHQTRKHVHLKLCYRDRFVSTAAASTPSCPRGDLNWASHLRHMKWKIDEEVGA